MKKLMIKSLGWLSLVASVILVKPVKICLGWAKRKVSPPLKVSLTRQSLMISLPANQGGRLHILPRPGGASGRTMTFEVAKPLRAVDVEEYVVMSRPDDLVLATYTSEAEAAQALATLNKALTGSLLWKWGVRLFLVWLAWLFVTSYIEVRQRTSNSSRQDIVAGEFAAPNIPSEPAAFQANPSVASPEGEDLSAYIFQQAKAAQLKAQKDALPIKAGVDNAASLTGFGLKDAGSNGSGGGCDPKLAFKVPTK